MDPGLVAIGIPIVAILVGGLIAITTMMTTHQRKMAELYRKDTPDPHLVEEVRAMRAEVLQLRDRVNQQMLMIDRQSPVQPPSGHTVESGREDGDVSTRLQSQ